MIDEADSKQFKAAFPAFAAQLSAEGMTQFLNSCSRVDFYPGHNVFRDRMPTDSVHFVISGEASIFVEKEDRNIPLGTVGTGALLGEISVLSRQMIASSTVQAVSRMTTLRLMHQPLESLLTSETTGPAMLDLLCETLASRLRAAH